ncbi:MAG: FAD-dependent oxidoreductase, partial [Steroidobacteraceae bacterium]
GHVGESPVLLARRGGEVFAIDALCTHYGGLLRDGLIVGDTVRCPWHHACFSLRTGEALAPPAVAPVRCWRVERRASRLWVRERAPAGASGTPTAGGAGRIVVVGGGAAGFGAAEMLRREGYDGEVTIVSAEDSPPYDRPNLSKDYLAGTAPEEWMPLERAERYAEKRITLRLGTTVTAIDPRTHRITLDGAGSLEYTRLLLATGAEPVRLKVPGADLPHVTTLRSLADCRKIIGLAGRSKRAVVIGASFIGLESAAALRQREVDVHVVAPEPRPLERVLGPALGDLLRSLHEAHGVVFHLGRQIAEIDAHSVRLDDGSRLEADLVLTGIGVRPRLALAEQAGLALDRGVLVDEYLETSAPDVFAAGDIARWPDPYSGERLRIEHWVVAERQGQTAARNMLGRRERYTAVPFFWTQHYDVSVNYVGHAGAWDRIDQRGDVAGRDAALRFEKGGRTLAVATVFRDRESLAAEVAMERGRSP